MSDDNDDKHTIDPKAHAALADAHERLKKDAKADRDALAEANRKAAEAEEAAEAAKADAAAKAGDVDAIKAQLEAKHAKELAKVTARAEKAEGQVNKLVIENGLDAALDAAKVSPALKKAAKALLREGAELKDDAGEPVALMGGKPLADAIKDWAASDEGKHFVINGNSGGGAEGGGGGGSEVNPWKSETRNLTKQGEIQRADPTKAKRLAAEAGVTLG